MSQPPALNLQPVKIANPQAELPTPTLPPKGTSSGAAGGSEQFRQLLQTRSPSSASELSVAGRNTAPSSAGIEAQARLPDAQPTGAAEHSPAATLARPDDLDAARASGAELRQQRLWADAQQREAPLRDGAGAAPVSNAQAPGDAAALSAAMAAAAAADPQAAATLPRSGDDLVTMLQKLCSQMYVAQGPDGSNARVLLDLGHVLPGSLVELAREGAFLRVRLHAADTQAGALMEAQRERLIASLTTSTRMGVTVDVVRPR